MSIKKKINDSDAKKKLNNTVNKTRIVLICMLVSSINYFVTYIVYTV